MVKEKLNASSIYGLLPINLDGVELLAKLALDLRISWKHNTYKIWNKLNPDLWEETHNPWLVLITASRDYLRHLLTDEIFRAQVNEIYRNRDLEHSKKSWFEETHAGTALKCLAYFSMEYMLNEALPIYVGGLGNVAGDQLKSASDLGIPVVAVGLLYQQGYFRQQIDQNGNQIAYHPYNDPGQLPVTPVRLADGEWLRIKMDFAAHTIWLRTWKVQVGHTQLFLLDSNDSANLPEHRSITSEIYGGGAELRIQQEIILGIGGWKMLRALGMNPDVCHMNEGHAAFLIFERAADFMKDNYCSFNEALSVTRAGNLFTTHTAVAAGFDHFDPSLMWRFFGDYAKENLDIEFDDMMALGRENGQDLGELFNMAYLAIRGSGSVNGVSRLHGEISQNLFASLFPRWPIPEIPIGYVTNGVHIPSWVSRKADKVWAEACGDIRWNEGTDRLKEIFNSLPDETLWQLRNDSRTDLVHFIEKISEADFNPRTLTIGFARRFVPYKRTNLLLHDKERFTRILKNSAHPVQVVIAGKVPPSDNSSQSLIREWIQFIHQYDVSRYVVFLEDYDMLLAEHMIQGVDLWVNTPRRPWEACGTSGMKVLANGGLNLSELDGWWMEAYNPEVGWALGDRQEHSADPGWDAAEAEVLYNLLEQEVIPDFYRRNDLDIPVDWIKKMRISMATLTPQFSSDRAVREYTEKYYLPLALSYQNRAAEKGAIGKKWMKKEQDMERRWEGVSFGNMEYTVHENNYHFTVPVFLNGIVMNDLLIELFADGVGDALPERILMSYEIIPDNADAFVFHADITGNRPAGDYTARIVPYNHQIAVPLENNLIKWQR